MADKILFTCSHHADDPERATLPFIAASVSAAAGRRTIVVCTIDAVRIGTQGGAEAITAPGMPPLKQLYDELVGNGGVVWLSNSCTGPRGIDTGMLAKGSHIVDAATVVEEIFNGARCVSLG